MNKKFFENYWQNKDEGEHRSREERFLKQEAKEKLYHLGKGDTLLDFGCGAAELTTYFCENFRKIYGVDFSESMLRQARKRTADCGLSHQISFFHAHEGNAWELLGENVFDIICCTGVVQYLDQKQLEAFISNASKRITPNGKIIIFDAIDPRIYFLYRIGLFRTPPANTLSVALRAIKVILKDILIFCRVLKPPAMGFAQHPQKIIEIAKKYFLHAEVVWSMYYEYRYHLILSRKKNGT